MCTKLANRYRPLLPIKSKDEFIDMLSTCTEDELTLLAFKSGSLAQYMQENLEEYRKTKTIRTIKYDPQDNEIITAYISLEEYLLKTSRFKLVLGEEYDNFQLLCITSAIDKLCTYYLFFGDLYFTVTLSAQPDIGLEELDIQWI